MHIEGTNPPSEQPPSFGSESVSFAADPESGNPQPMTVSPDSALSHVARAYVVDRPSGPTEQAEPTELTGPTEPTGETGEGAEPFTTESLHAAYPQYADAVRSLGLFPTPLLSRGDFKDVYRLPGFEGLAAKFYTGPISRRGQLIRQEEPAFVATHGLPVFNQVRASSPGDGVVIADEVDGTQIEKADADALDALTVPSLRAVAQQTTEALRSRGLSLDGNPGHVMVVPSGLHCIDPELIGTQYVAERGEHEVNLNLYKIAYAIATAGNETQQGVDRAARHRALGRFAEAVIDADLYTDNLSADFNRLGRYVKNGYFDAKPK